MALIAEIGLPVDIASLSAVAFSTAATLLAALVLRNRPGLQRLSICFGAQGITWLAGFAGGVIALAGLRLQFPLRDVLFLATDHRLGLDGPSYIAWTTHAPAIVARLVGASYTSTLGIVLLSMSALALLGDRLEVWRATFCFAGALVTTSLISIFVPAKGVASWEAPELLARLPAEAGRYFWPAFDRFYSGSAPVIRLGTVDAVVSFPSFHMAMGLIVVMLWRGRPIALTISLAWFFLMVAGTVPLGGHYFVDLIGGFIVWAAWFGLSVCLARADHVLEASSSPS
jgi:membrane-associated phospholipid phosphatase